MTNAAIETQKLDTVWNACVLADRNFRYNDRDFFKQVLAPKLAEFELDIVQAAAIELGRTWSKQIAPNPHAILEYIKIERDRVPVKPMPPEEQPDPSLEEIYEVHVQCEKSFGRTVPDFETWKALRNSGETDG